MSYRDGAIREVEYCPSCGGFLWGCLECGEPARISDIARAGKGAHHLFRKTRILTSRELSAIIYVCISSGPPHGTRDAALIAVLCSGRLQASELVALRLEDWAPHLRTLSVRAQGNRPSRRVVLDMAAANAVERWIPVRGRQSGMLFVDLHGTGGQARGAGIGTAAVRGALQKRAAQAGIGHVTVADLHSASLRPVVNSTPDSSDSTENTQNENTEKAISQAMSEPSPTPSQLQLELAGAARKLSSLRPIDPDGPGPLNDLTTRDLVRLRRRVSAILLRREVVDLEGGRELGGRLPSPATRSKIATATADGIPKEEISRLIGVSRKTINGCVKEARKNNASGTFIVKDKPYDGVPKIGDNEKRVILADLEARPSASLRERNAHLAETTGIHVAYQTVLAHIRKLGFGCVDGLWIRVESTNALRE